MADPPEIDLIAAMFARLSVALIRHARLDDTLTADDEDFALTLTANIVTGIGFTVELWTQPFVLAWRKEAGIDNDETSRRANRYLQPFLKDGYLRGVSPAGQIALHRLAEMLNGANGPPKPRVQMETDGEYRARVEPILRAAMKHRGLTVAGLMKTAGCTRQHYYDLLKGKASPVTLDAIANALDLPVTTLRRVGTKVSGKTRQ